MGNHTHVKPGSEILNRMRLGAPWDLVKLVCFCSPDIEGTYFSEAEYAKLYALAPNIQHGLEELDAAVAEARKVIKKRIKKQEEEAQRCWARSRADGDNQRVGDSLRKDVERSMGATVLHIRESRGVPPVEIDSITDAGRTAHHDHRGHLRHPQPGEMQQQIAQKTGDTSLVGDSKSIKGELQ